MQAERPEAILRNELKAKLARDEVALSMTVRLVRSVEIARLARTCGYDSLYVDLEHNSFSLDSTSQICCAALSAGITPLVRVPASRPEYVGRALDGGAMGVIAPHVRCAADVEAVVRLAKYPPQGERSAGGLLPQLHYRRFPVAAAHAALNAATLVFAMLETRAALDEVDAIAAVDGLDLLLIGTNDLCAELGIAGQFDHPLVGQAYASAIAACRRHGKHVGIGGLGARPDLIAGFIAQGARYVSAGSDLDFLVSGAGGFVAELESGR
jgi:4-hydroxy-2-oxoheptanedioate aldolase